ncbi:hypothetical protein GYA19_03200 [Candidatus Beckwithbacteria bacterium]|nr:hypothetical protein [Candidatus Beckwithbacteria bacterium]
MMLAEIVGAVPKGGECGECRQGNAMARQTPDCGNCGSFISIETVPTKEGTRYRVDGVDVLMDTKDLQAFAANMGLTLQGSMS